MEESVGMVIGMNEIVQDSGKTGNALKTISANLAGVSASAKDGTIQTNKTAKALKEIAGIEVWNKQTGEIKDMYSTMDELHSKWSTLNEDQQNALGTAIAGKTQLNTFSALMSNWDTVTDYVDEYNKGLTVGSAQKENLRYLDSIDGKWNTIKENMKSVANTLTTGDMAKGALDVVIGITEGLDKGVSAYSEMVSIMSDGTMFKTMSDGMFNFLDNMDYQKFFGNFSDMIGELTKGKFNLGEMFNLDEFGASLNKFFDSSFGNKLQGTLSDLYGGAMKILEEIALPPGIEAIFDIGRKFKEDKALENSIEERNRNLKVYADEIASLKAVQEATKQLAPAYEELSNKQKRSAEEEQKLIDIRNQLAEINPESVLGYDKDGNAILRNLDLSNAQLERQIKLKQQSQRLEENALANDVQAKRIKDQKEYNKLLEEAYNLPLTADTDRKDSLYTGLEDISDYAKRIQEQNQKINEENAKIYSDRLQAHQQYVADEKAIQEKYINQMEGSQTFGKMAEEAQRGILSFMGTLDWSSFTDGQAISLTNQLSRMSDKIVETTKEMGNHAKSIDDLEQSYANGEKNMISYTEGLGKIYETAKKVDAESLSNWKIGLEDYASLTGDLDGVNACIERMAQSLTKITGINTDTWKKALTFDPAPIDASNQALQRFLNSYKTGVQNLGKGGLADVLQNQFQNLQTSHLQLVDDLASGKTIDVEYLINAKVNQPKPIRSLIDEIIKDGNVDAVELEVLIEAQTELLNEGSISEETKSKIADIFGMSETEVEQLVKVNAKVETNMADFEAYVNEWEELDTQEKELILRSVAESEGDFEATIEKWDTLSEEEKQQILKQIIEKDGNVEEAIKTFEGVEEGTKEQTLEQKSEGSDEIKTDNEYYRSINSEKKEQSLEQKSVNSDGLKTDNEYFKSQVTEGEKKQTLNQGSEGWQKLQEADGYFQQLFEGTKFQELWQKAFGKEDVEESSNTFKNAPEGKKEAEYNVKSSGKEEVEETGKMLDGLPKTKEIVVSVVQSGTNLIDSIANWINSKAEQNVEIKAKVGKVDTSALDGIKAKDIDIKAKVGKVDTGALDGIKAKDIDIKAKVDKVDTSALDGIKAKDVEIKAKVGKVDTSALNGINAPTIDVSAKVTGLDQVNSLKSSLSSIQNKVVSITASGNALAQVNQIKTALSGIQSKSISISAGGNALGQINSIKSALVGLQSKTVSVTAIANGIGNVNALKASIAGLQGKSVSVSASTSGTGEVNALTSAIGRVQGKSVSVVANVSGTSAVNALTSAINKVKSKSVKVSASVSGTSAVQALASAISSVRSKTVSVNVNRRVTESVTRSAVGNSVSAYSVNTANVSLASAPVATNNVSSVTPSYGTVTASASNPLSSSTVNLKNLMEEFKFDIDSFKNLEEALNRISGHLGIVEEKMENAFGKEKISLLHQQINLLKQQQDVQERIFKAEEKQNGELYKWLNNKGFKINDVGDITNYQDQLLKMEKNVESLKKKYDALNDVTGNNKNEDAIKKANKAYEDANEELNEVKKHLEEYVKTNNSEMSDAKKKWYEYQNAIIKAEEELNNIKRELKELDIDSGYKDNDRDIAMVENRLDMLDALVEGFEALGDDADINAINSVLTQRVEVIKQLQKEMNDLLNYELGLKDSLIYELSKYGFKIRDDGSIEGYGQKIKELKQTLSENEFEIVFEMVEEYLEKIEETIPGILLEWQKLNNEITETETTIEENARELAEEMEEARKEAEKLSQEKFLKGIEDSIERVNYLFDELNDKISLLEAKAENANGSTRINYLKEEIGLLERQVRLANNSYTTLLETSEKLKNELGKNGVSVFEDGTNNLQSFMEAENYDYLENLADEYVNVQEQLRDMKIEAVEAQNEIENLKLEIKQIRRENSLMKLDSMLSVINGEFEQMSLLINEINDELEYSYGTDKINKMTESIELMNKQLELQINMLDNAKAKLLVYKNDLTDYGAEFDDEGNIINLDEIIKIQSNSNTFEDFEDVLEGYFDAQSEIRDVIGDYNDLEIAIKDAYREQLEITQEIEEELTEILEKELEKRKDAVEEYTESRIKLLEEEKKAYKEMRDEQNYNESVDDQLKEIEVLRKQIETARKDTSISGQKRLAELTKELTEAEKELAEITQDKIDQDYESNIDKEIEKLEEEQDAILKSLDEKFSEENIAKIVAEALTNGFIEINGEIQSVQDVLMDSINNSVDGYSVMADVIKNELVANLNVALNTMKEIESINDTLGLQNYNLISSTSLSTLKEPTYESGNNVTIGDTYLNISGNVSEDIISDIEDLIDQKNNEMLNKIASNL